MWDFNPAEPHIFMSYEVAVPMAPFEGQVYHCPIVSDFKDKKDQSSPVRECVSAAFHGGMNSKAVNGIKRGEEAKPSKKMVLAKRFTTSMRCTSIQLSLPIMVVKRSRTTSLICKSFFGSPSLFPSMPSLNLLAILPGRTLLVSSTREDL